MLCSVHKYFNKSDFLVWYDLLKCRLNVLLQPSCLYLHTKLITVDTCLVPNVKKNKKRAFSCLFPFLMINDRQSNQAERATATLEQRPVAVLLPLQQAARAFTANKRSLWGVLSELLLTCSRCSTLEIQKCSFCLRAQLSFFFLCVCVCSIWLLTGWKEHVSDFHLLNAARRWLNKECELCSYCCNIFYPSDLRDAPEGLLVFVCGVQFTADRGEAATGGDQTILFETRLLPNLRSYCRLSSRRGSRQPFELRSTFCTFKCEHECCRMRDRKCCFVLFLFF